MFKFFFGVKSKVIMFFFPYIIFNCMLVKDLIIVGGFSCSVRSRKQKEVTFLLKINIIGVFHYKVLPKYIFVNLQLVILNKIFIYSPFCLSINTHSYYQHICKLGKKGSFFWLYYQTQVWLLATQKTSNLRSSVSRKERCWSSGEMVDSYPEPNSENSAQP